MTGTIRLMVCAALTILISAPMSQRSAVWAQTTSAAAGATAGADNGANASADTGAQALPPAPAGLGAQAGNSVAPIGPGDVLMIGVVDQPDLSHAYQVDANGDITMLYVGKLHVAGLSIDQATNAVKNALGKIYVNPIVTVNRAQMGGNAITVTGAVARQGTQPVRRDARLNDVIQVAGPIPDADLTRIQITRGLPGQQHQTLTFNLAAFLSNGDISNNPPLSDGDVIFVPNKAPITYSVSIVGAVNKPGRYDIQPNSTVYDLVGVAGGLQDSADRTNIYIQPAGTIDRHPFNYDEARQSPQNPTTNPVLHDGDKVVVPEVQNVPMFSITGAVLGPRQYPIRGRVSLADAIGMAGGLADRAKTDQITVTREGTNGAQIIKVNAKNNPAIAGNFQVEPGDNIYIPQGSPGFRLDPLQAFGILIALYGIFRH